MAAREQGGGYGTRGRVWHSPVGGLWMSVVLRPRLAARAEGLSLRVGLAVASALEREVPRLGPLMIKWPNDLLLDGRKLGGILCEARWQGEALAWVVAGIGLNVANPLPAEVAETAATLREGAPGLDPADLAGPVARAVAEATREGGPLTTAELDAFRARDWTYGREVTSPVAGVARGITADGALRVETGEGVEEVARST